MEGVWRSTAEVTVFLDSHIEVGPEATEMQSMCCGLFGHMFCLLDW